MENTTVKSRARRWLLLPLSVSALLLAAACVPPAEPDPNTPWLAPGCVSSTQDGVPDFKFTGVANVVGNATAFLDENDQYVEDGSCEGTPTDSGIVVRAATQEAAATICANLGAPVAEPPRLVDWGYGAPIDAWTCEGEVPDGVVEFSGPGVVAVTMYGGTPEEPTATTVEFTGNGSGSWDQGDSGDFAVNLDVDPGSFPVENSPIGPITVFYTAAQNGTANGNFDPATGEGGFSMSVTMTLVGLNAPEGMPPPCDIVSDFDFEGAIDLDTGELTVSQENFSMTPPAETDCGGLGALIAPMMTDGANEASMSFQVFEP